MRHKERNYKKRALRMLIASAALAVFLALLLVLRTSNKVSEWMAVNISRGWISVFSKITGILPFSLYETLIYVLIFGITALIVTAIVFFCKKKGTRAVTYLLVILLTGLSFGNIYTISAGFAYNRGEPDLPYYEASRIGETDAENLIALAEFMMDDFNAASASIERDENGGIVSPYSFNELAAKLREEYKRLDSPYYSSYTPLAKPITSKKIMSNMHLTGVFFAPFGEANVNPMTPACDIPVTMAHELAHSKGAMRESDANLTAYWLTITSDDPYLRYSGYMECYRRMLDMVSFFDSQKANELREAMDDGIYRDMELSNEFWAKYTLFDKVTDFFNDLYLKLQGQKDGTGSYQEPLLPPSTETKPSPEGGGGTVTEKFYNLNTMQKMMLKAVEDRMNKVG